jgi:hypothetical protein
MKNKTGKIKSKIGKMKSKIGKIKSKTRKMKSKTLFKNILGTQLVPCGSEENKKTGYYRNGICSNGESDVGTHIVCAVVDNDFLQFTKSKGNDLITPTYIIFSGFSSWRQMVFMYTEVD